MKQSKIILVTGGVRCGKSEFAENYARELEWRREDSEKDTDSVRDIDVEMNDGADQNVLYIATSKNDFGMQARIEAHRRRRPSTWRTLEKYKGFVPEDFEDTDIALLDCAGVMATNLMFDAQSLDSMSEGELFDFVWREFDALVRAARECGTLLIVVSNEVGWGLVSEHKVGNQFRDLLGAVNKAIAGLSDEVYLLVAGIPLQIKGRGES